MAAQDQGCGGGGEDALRRPYVTVSSWAGAELVVVRLSRVPSSSFEGCDVEEVREWVAQCYGMTLAIPHSTCTEPGMAVQCGLVEQRRDLILRRCQKTGVAGIRL
jgi:hypothetical protein